MTAMGAEFGEGAFDPFSPRDFEMRALRRGHRLAEAEGVFGASPAHGIDAGGIAVDANGAPLAPAGLNGAQAEADLRECAVLVPIVAREPLATVLLTRRTTHLKSHAGQIAFPGGKVEPEDKTPIDTALREAAEEIGLDAGFVRPLSLLAPHRTGTGFRIVPVLGLVDASYTAKANPSEVDDVFEIPLAFLMRTENHERHYAEWKGQRRQFYAMTYGDRFVWGATAAILRTLYERLYAP
jgi:8-oxo-dGTP pyrophosphatase MutT (NUDIX family)